MPALNGVKNSVANKAKKKGKNPILLAVLISIILSVLVTILLMLCAWKLVLEDKVYSAYNEQSNSGGFQVYKASRDIAQGEDINGAIEVITIPGSLMVSDALVSSSDTSGLKASTAISANTIIATDDVYNPTTQDIILPSTREVSIDYLETPGIVTGDFIDIRLKVYSDASGEVYKDSIVCSKKLVLDKAESGSVELLLSESEILNINSAVVEAATAGNNAELYVTKYVDPANQPKATITYSGSGKQYTDVEIEQAKERLKEIQSGKDSYNYPDINR